MLKIAVSGSTGFVGSYLVKSLGDKFEFIPLDLRKKGDINLQSCDGVIHLAGKAHDLKKSTSPQEYYSVNFELTKEIFNQFIGSEADTFIFISSVKASADSVSHILLEEHSPNPKTDYGKSKLLAENYLLNTPLPSGKSLYILRPSMIHGPGNKGNLNLLYRFVRKRIPYPLASFENSRSFLSVDNLCFVIEELLKRDDIPSGIYQIVDDDPISTNDLVRLIGLASGKKSILWGINPALIRSLASIGDLFGLPLNSERLGKLTESYVISNNKLKSVLKKELPIKASDGIITTIKSFNNL